jgi:hypothetical protein
LVIATIVLGEKDPFIVAKEFVKDIGAAIEVGLKLPFTTSNAGKPVMDANAVKLLD